MSSQNIPPPPQYPNYSNAESNDPNVSRENSVMENSVIYISDGGSPNYKTNRKNGYQQSTNQILPNLVNSINSTYQNLPPKSPKSNYRNMLNHVEATQKNSPWRQNEVQNDPLAQTYRQTQDVGLNKQNQQFWMVKPSENIDCNNGFSERHENINPAAAKTRSHPNLMNDYVNLAGTETLLNDILYSRGNRQLIPVSNDSNKNYMFKPQQMNHDQFTTVYGPPHTSPEFVRNGLQLYPSQGLAEYATNPDNFSNESSRLVNLLLEENKRLRSKLRQSDSRLESVDQLERKIHNLEILFEELLTSQRRQRLLDLQLQQASLTNHIVKNVSKNDTVSLVGRVTSSPDNNGPIDLRKTVISTSQSIIPSSPIISQKLIEESPGERSMAFSSKQQKNDVAKVYFDQRNCNDSERYLIENECSDNWMEQARISPIQESELNVNQTHFQKLSDDDLCIRLKQTIKSLNIATSPYFSRISDHQNPLISSPSDLLGRKVTMSHATGPARNWLLHQSSTPPSYRLRLCQQPALLNMNYTRAAASPKATSALNLTSS